MSPTVEKNTYFLSLYFIYHFIPWNTLTFHNLFSHSSPFRGQSWIIRTYWDSEWSTKSYIWKRKKVFCWGIKPPDCQDRGAVNLNATDRQTFTQTHTDRYTDRRTDRYAHRHTDRQTGGRADEQADRRADGHTHISIFQRDRSS